MGEWGENPSEGITHHELFHLLDQELSPEITHDDPEWSELNPAGFAYRNRLDEEQVSGFINSYAMRNAAEDRASVFENLMSAPEVTCILAEDHPILAAKILLIARRLAPRIELAFLAARAPCSKLGAR
jgi:hypothetical protein